MGLDFILFFVSNKIISDKIEHEYDEISIKTHWPDFCRRWCREETDSPDNYFA